MALNRNLHGVRPATSSLKEKVEIVKGILTIGAILAAGWWFVMQGFARPEVKLEHTVTQRRLETDKSKWVLAIEVKATNVGKVPVHLKAGTLVIQQVNPESKSDDATLEKVELREMSLDPGEADQAIVQTFLFPEAYKTILLQSRYVVPRMILGFEVSSKPHYQWKLETVVDIGSGGEG